MKEVETGLARFLGGASGDDDELGVGIIGRFARIDGDRWEVGLTVDEIKNVPTGKLFVLVNENNLIGETTLGEGVTIGGADSTGTNDNNLAVF